MLKGSSLSARGIGLTLIGVALLGYGVHKLLETTACPLDALATSETNPLFEDLVPDTAGWKSTGHASGCFRWLG